MTTGFFFNAVLEELSYISGMFGVGSNFRIALILISCAYASGRRAKHVSICNSAGFEAKYRLARLPFEAFRIIMQAFRLKKTRNTVRFWMTCWTKNCQSLLSNCCRIIFFARLIKNSQRQNHSLRNLPMSSSSFVTLPTFLTKSNYNIPLNHTFCSVTCQTAVGSRRPDTLITQNWPVFGLVPSKE